MGRPINCVLRGATCITNAKGDREYWNSKGFVGGTHSREKESARGAEGEPGNVFTEGTLPAVAPHPCVQLGILKRKFGAYRRKEKKDVNKKRQPH